MISEPKITPQGLAILIILIVASMFVIGSTVYALMELSLRQQDKEQRP